jgi:hypothetical protein
MAVGEKESKEEKVVTSSRQRDFITIVSGLPRSGTSMMMQMLEAGGMPVVVDHERRPDADNPHGYYEFEPVKQLKQNSVWLSNALGAAVKVIYLLLYDLPSDYRYRLIFMRRNLEEVIASQEGMLRRMGRADTSPDVGDMAQLFEINLKQVDQWLPEQDNFELLNMQYDEVIASPAVAAQQIADFLGGGLDQAEMAAVVNPALYRHR